MRRLREVASTMHWTAPTVARAEEAEGSSSLLRQVAYALALADAPTTAGENEEALTQREAAPKEAQPWSRYA